MSFGPADLLVSPVLASPEGHGRLEGPDFRFDALERPAASGARAGLSAESAQRPLPRQRLKLWQLAASMHCSVIGTCLTTGELRRAMGRVLQSDVAFISDHDLHAKAVGLCGTQTAASKALNKALDQRHRAAIGQYSQLRTEAAVMARWADARRAGDIPGAYWAVLTHPDVGLVAAREAFGDVHMLSHLVGAANRADIRRLTALEAENAALLSKVERQQLRLQELAAARDAAIKRQTELAASGVKAGAPADDETLSELRDLVADLRARLAREVSRREHLERRAVDAAEMRQRCEQITRALAVSRRLETGICHINGPTVADEAQVPFGGVKASGYGRFGGKAVVNEFTNLRWITIEGPQRYPF